MEKLIEKKRNAKAFENQFVSHTDIVYNQHVSQIPISNAWLSDIIATLKQLIEPHEHLLEDTSNAGHSPEKQEGNVHGYEQEEVTVKDELYF